LNATSTDNDRTGDRPRPIDGGGSVRRLFFLSGIGLIFRNHSSENSKVFTQAPCLLLRRKIFGTLAKPIEIARLLACLFFGHIYNPVSISLNAFAAFARATAWPKRAQQHQQAKHLPIHVHWSRE
jgi:hypothetical protein